MQLLKNIHVHLGRIIGMAVVCAFLGVFILHYSHMQLSEPIELYQSQEDVTLESAKFKTPASVHKLNAVRRTHCHFSLRTKTAVKHLMKKGSSALLSLAHLHFAENFIGNVPVSAPIVVLPGYYLFLFRYALF